MRLHLFDLDGTLTDSRGGLYASFRVGLAAVGCGDPTDAELAPFLGTPLPILFRTLCPGIGQAGINRGIQAFRAFYEEEGIYGNRLYPGACDLLRAVRAIGGRAWIVTSKPEPQAVRVAALLDVETLVEGVIGAGPDETDTKTELVGRALSAAGIPASETLMLGDRHYDVIGARENGVLPVGALWGYGSRKELTDAGCTRFVRTCAEYCSKYLLTDALEPRRKVAAG
jgi:phosphoglycolate phosphatase